MRLGNVVIYVPDVPMAVQFYTKAFQLEERFTAPNGDFGELETGATALGFVSEALLASGNQVFRANRPNEDAAAVKVALVVDDVQAAFEHALENGASRYDDPVENHGVRPLPMCATSTVSLSSYATNALRWPKSHSPQGLRMRFVSPAAP